MPENRDPVRRRMWVNAYRKRLRATVFAGYGNKCACCGETEPAFLSIDHVNNDGASWRRTGRGDKTVLQIIREDFPPAFQLLCFNCNCAKGFSGACPHDKQR